MGQTQSVNGQANKLTLLLVAGKIKAIPSSDFYRETGVTSVKWLAIERLATSDFFTAFHAAQEVEHVGKMLAHSSRTAKSSGCWAFGFIKTLNQGVVKQEPHYW